MWGCRPAVPGSWSRPAPTIPPGLVRTPSAWPPPSGAACDDADVRFIDEPAALATLWRIREDGAGHSSRFADGTKGWPGFEDSAVPPERLGAYLG